MFMRAMASFSCSSSRVCEALKQFADVASNDAPDFPGSGWCDRPTSAIRSKLSKVEFEDEEEDEDEFQFVFPASPQLLKEGLCCSERRPLFRRVAREKA